jgi:hypothetical protein
MVLTTTMTAMPQDIIDSIIEAVGDDDDSLRMLKQCALVSSSFLLPSRRRLFSKTTLRSDKACQRLYQLLIDNPVVQSFVRSIIVELSQKLFGPHLIAILRFPFCRLESFSMLNLDLYRSDWTQNRPHWYTPELMDALSSISHSSTLKTLRICRINAPIMLFRGMHLTKLVLYSFMPNVFGGGLEASDHSVIDQCVWQLDDLVSGL